MKTASLWYNAIRTLLLVAHSQPLGPVFILGENVAKDMPYLISCEIGNSKWPRRLFSAHFQYKNDTLILNN
jgi:hypothetical protein